MYSTSHGFYSSYPKDLELSSVAGVIVRMPSLSATRTVLYDPPGKNIFIIQIIKINALTELTSSITTKKMCVCAKINSE